jgi:DeoR/GlpR family transcriptional regulator of sugar metabolism
MPQSSLRRADRVSAILERVASHGSVDAGHLAGEFRVSPATIRRDLQVLEDQRLLARTHGGAVAVDVAYELVGPIADQALKGLNMAVAVVGVDGISARGGLTTHDEIEANTNATMIRRADRVIVVADGSKVGKVCLAGICPVTDVSALVTDASADPVGVEAIRRTGTEVIVAGIPRG